MNREPEDTVSASHTEASSSSKEEVIADLQKSDQLQELRNRLYARDGRTTDFARHTLPRHATTPVQSVPQTHSDIVPTHHTPSAIISQTPQTPITPPTVLAEKPMPKKRSYRTIIILAGITFLLVALAVSSYIMFSGTNTISNENITVTSEGSLTVGGGDEYSFDVSIRNENTLPIQSVVLIVEYPEGTQAATEERKTLTTERQSLNTIEVGQEVKIPFKVRIFGEENEEREIKVRVEYRVVGSSGTFKKDAESHKIKISTSPVVLSFDTVKTISSGQEFTLDLVIQSNASTPVTNTIIKIKYPEGFDYTSANMETLSGEDTWRIDTLKPNEKKTLSIKGLITGYETDFRRFEASAGVGSDGGSTITSELSRASTEIRIEQPFLDIQVSVNENAKETIVITERQDAYVGIAFKNALDTTIYDGKIIVELSGNALNEYNVQATNGFYDSAKNTIVWDAIDASELKEILPGKTGVVRFQLSPRSDIGRTPEMNLKVTMNGKRTFGERAPESLVGNVSRTIKVESIPTFTSVALHSEGSFMNTGPVPPIAEQSTEYTYTFKVRAGKNDLTKTEMTAVVPIYMKWLDVTTDATQLTYNPANRTLTWNAGDVNAGEEKTVSAQVAFSPSLTQVGSSPVILESQRLKATDRFTGTTVRASGPALTTSFFNESDGTFSDGKVRASE